MIAVNWGSSNFRAYRVDREGKIISRRISDRGVLKVEQTSLPAILREEVNEWVTDGERRILLSGMIGGRQGWRETPYVPTPASLMELTAKLVPVEFGQCEVYIVPGVSAEDEHGVPEMMRGEETEIFGVLAAGNRVDRICLPGTHSKWVSIRDQKISGFLTFMTGELFEVLKKYSILGRLMEKEEFREEDFLQGIRRASDSKGILHHLFGARSLVLSGRLVKAHAASYLSGLVIGHEVIAMRPLPETVLLIGEPWLCFLYSKALEACGVASSIAPADAAAAGLTAIAREILWI